MLLETARAAAVAEAAFKILCASSVPYVLLETVGRLPEE
jgi:hypothetical protein